MGRRGKRGGQVGRPRKRVDSARQEAPAAWGRIAQISEDVQRLRVAEDAIIKDARLTTMLYRLKLFGKISELEHETGCMVAEIYGLHDRLVTGAKRHAASPSYDKGWSKGDSLAAERMSEDEVKSAERLARRARSRWNRVQSCLGEHERAVVEDVCVFNHAAPASLSDLLSDALTVIATEFGVFDQAKTQARKAPQTKASPRHTADAPLRPTPQNVSREKEAFKTTMHHARPDMDAAELEKAWALNTALKDRDRFRQDKERGRAVS